MKITQISSSSKGNAILIDDGQTKCLLDAGISFKKLQKRLPCRVSEIDIINTIGKHYGETAPVIIDNAESVVKIKTYGLQVISLYVSEDDNELRIEEV